ncbi:MAG: amidotransferase, partial [Pyrinomonas methylaliphatogenes]|nr:amidotransferase [Pyrinomonas methylaliphatogenes]
MKIHYLQHVPFEDAASIKDWISKNDLRASCTRFYAGDPLPQIDDFDWLIVMGGP